MDIPNDSLLGKLQKRKKKTQDKIEKSKGTNKRYSNRNLTVSFMHNHRNLTTRNPNASPVPTITKCG